jgi:hypothetical protein
MIFLEYLAVGLGGGLILIFLAKVVMAGLLQRENDYYRDAFDGDEVQQGGDADV